MGLQLKVTLPESLQGKGKIADIETLKPSILLEGGKALQELLAQWMRDLNAARSKHGSNHFTPEDVHEPVVEESTVSVPIFTPGITRALHDIVIRPVEANALAIPVHADAYGTSPREYNLNHPKGTPEALFRPKDKDYLAKNDGGKLVVMYLLRNSVHQPQDPSLLPSEEQMASTVMEAVSNAVKAILEN